MPLPLQTSDFIDQLFDAMADQGVAFADIALLKSAAVDLFTAWLGGEQALPADLGQKFATQIGVQTAKTLNDYDWYTTPVSGGPRSDGTIDFVLPDGTTVPLDGRAKLIESLAKGDPGGVNFTFSTTTTDADPGAGKLRFNNAALASVTALYFDDTERGGATVTAWLDGFGAADGDIKGLLYLQEVETAKIAVFEVTGAVVDGTGYRKVPVAHAAGAAPFGDEAKVAATFARTGPSDYETWRSLEGNEAGTRADYIDWQVAQVTANAETILQPIADAAAVSAAQAEVSAAAVYGLVGLVQTPVVAIGGRDVQPTALSFDLYVLAGIYLDTGAPYDPLGLALALTVQAENTAGILALSNTTVGLMSTAAVSIGGRDVQPTELSFDLYVLAGIYLDTGEPFDPLGPGAEVPALVEKMSAVLAVDTVTIGGREVQPTQLSFDLYVIEGRYLDDGARYAPFETSISAARIERQFGSFGAFPPVLPQRVALETWSQSNGIGAGQATALTLATRYAGRVLTFNGGPKADPDAPAEMASTMNLVEDSHSGDGGGNIRGETIVSGACYGMLEAHFIRQAILPAAMPKIFGHTAGKGGQAISTLSKGGTYYPRITTSMQAAKDLATGAGETFALGAILFDQGEANQGVMAQAIYQTAMRTLYNDLVTDLKAITGQSFDPIMVVMQKSWGALDNGGTNTYPGSVTLAQAAEQGAGIFVAGPDYQFSFNGSDHIHRVAADHALAGHLYGRVVQRVLLEGKDWRPLQPRSAWVRGQECFVRFDVPVQPLVLDYTHIGPTTQSGFKLSDGSGEVVIDHVEIHDGQTVRLTLARACVGAMSLRYALDYLPSGSNLATGSAGGNLRDSDQDDVLINGTVRLLANWSLAFSLTPLLMD